MPFISTEGLIAFFPVHVTARCLFVDVIVLAATGNLLSDTLQYIKIRLRRHTAQPRVLVIAHLMFWVIPKDRVWMARSQADAFSVCTIGRNGLPFIWRPFGALLHMVKAISR